MPAWATTPAAPVTPEPLAAPIPFVVGLTVTGAVAEPAGDYESLHVVTSIDPRGYRISVSADVPGPGGTAAEPLSARRRVLATDQASARRMRIYFQDDDEDVFPGTVPGFSAVLVQELRASGKTAFTYLDVGPGFDGSKLRGELSGTLVRVRDPVSTLPVLVNDRLTAVPVLHARGTLAGPSGSGVYDFFVLDDPANPMLLRAIGGGNRILVTRIGYPQPAMASGSLESALSKDEVVPVYGIYFSFNRADLRPESDPTLAEIAKALDAHPKWSLRVDGHTDGIGSHAANLELSRRRSAAVKEALVTRFHVASSRLVTGGYGDSSPQATNDTAEGRARNRRVELRRQ